MAKVVKTSETPNPLAIRFHLDGKVVASGSRSYPDVESAQAWAKQQRIEREKQIAQKQDQQQKQPSEVEIRLAAEEQAAIAEIHQMSKRFKVQLQPAGDEVVVTAAS